jgi:hypothetical protein
LRVSRPAAALAAGHQDDGRDHHQHRAAEQRQIDE